MKKLFFLALAALALMVACNSANTNESESTNSDINPAMDIKPGKKACNQWINDYDALVERSILYAEAALSGNPPTEAETSQLNSEAQELSTKITALGVDGIGGAECWQEFVAVQLKWSQAAMKLNQSAMDKANEMMQQYNNQ